VDSIAFRFVARVSMSSPEYTLAKATMHFDMMHTFVTAAMNVSSDIG
jgi:hypothetical protein